MIAAKHIDDFIDVDPFVGLYNEFIDHHGRLPGEVDLILPEANEYGVRFFVENNYPPLQIYGTTTKSWGINYHRHIPFSGEDCSVCRFPSTDVSPDMVCSKNEVSTSTEKQIDAALPFLSVGAAILTIADIMRLQISGYPHIPNFAYIDF